MPTYDVTDGDSRGRASTLATETLKADALGHVTSRGRVGAT